MLYIKLLNKYFRERYKNVSEEKKEKRRQYHHEHNKNLSEEETEKKVECMKNNYLAYTKYLLSWFLDFWGPGEILFDGLVLGKLKKFLNTFYGFGGFFTIVFLIFLRSSWDNFVSWISPWNVGKNCYYCFIV